MGYSSNKQTDTRVTTVIPANLWQRL